jgi:hypothetical protein
LLKDYSSYLIKNIIVRQLRVRNNSCQIYNSFKAKIEFCESDYDFFTQDSESYDLNWSKLGPNLNDSDSINGISKAFQYSKSNKYESYPYFGKYNQYFGGGYVYELINRNDDGSIANTSEIIQNINKLKEMNWIDRQTRAIFIEFSVFNPNINLFSYCIFLFEYLPSSNLVKSIRINPLSLILLNQSNDVNKFKLACCILYMICISFMIVQQAYILLFKMNKSFKKYFCYFWTYIDLSIIGFSWAAFSLYLYKLYEIDKLLNRFNNIKDSSNKESDYINLQYLYYLNDLLIMCLGYCSAIGTIKLFEILNKTSKRIMLLALTLKDCFGDIISFSLVFFLIWLPFIHLMYFIYFDKINTFSTFLSCMMTLVQIILGKFQSDSLIKQSPILGSVGFIVYNIVIIFIALNIFFTILTESFSKLKSDINSNEEFDFVNYSFFKLRILIDKYIGKNSIKSKNKVDNIKILS